MALHNAKIQQPHIPETKTLRRPILKIKLSKTNKEKRNKSVLILLFAYLSDNIPVSGINKKPPILFTVPTKANLYSFSSQ